MKNGIFVSQDKYIKDMLKKFGMNEAKGISTPMALEAKFASSSYLLITCLSVVVEFFNRLFAPSSH